MDNKNYLQISTYELLKTLERHKKFSDEIHGLFLSFTDNNLKIISNRYSDYASSDIYYKNKPCEIQPNVKGSYFYIDFYQLIAELKKVVKTIYLYLRPEEINGLWYIKICDSCTIPIYKADKEANAVLSNIKWNLLI